MPAGTQLVLVLDDSQLLQPVMAARIAVCCHCLWISEAVHRMKPQFPPPRRTTPPSHSFYRFCRPTSATLNVAPPLISRHFNNLFCVAHHDYDTRTHPRATPGAPLLRCRRGCVPLVCCRLISSSVPCGRRVVSLVYCSWGK